MATVDADLVGIDNARLYATNERVGSSVAMKDQTVVRWTAAYDPEKPNAIVEKNELVIAVKHIDSTGTVTQAAVIASAAKLDTLIKIITDALAGNGDLDTAAILASIDHVSKQVADLTTENEELRTRLAAALVAE